MNMFYTNSSFFALAQANCTLQLLIFVGSCYETCIALPWCLRLRWW